VKRVRVVVSGRVQGVFFRADCERVAVARGLAGFVRNLPNGDVEAAFEGPDADVDAAAAWCSEGPVLALVGRVEVSPEPTTGESGFRIR